MAKIDRVVEVQIALNTAGLSKEGFSTILVAGPHSIEGSSSVIAVTDANELLEAGMSPNNPVYFAVRDAFSQTPRPSVVKVGNMGASSVIVRLPGGAKAGEHYGFIIMADTETSQEAVQATVESTSADSVETILHSLSTQLSATAYDGVVTGSGDNAILTISLKNGVSTNFFFESDNPEVLSFSPVASTADLAKMMARYMADDNDFYGVVLADRTEARQLEMAAVCEAEGKLFGCASAEPYATGIVAKLKEKNYDRAFAIPHAQAALEYPEAALMARCFSFNPGSGTWANKRLSGITADKLTETDYIAITKLNGNTFEPFRNLAISQNGKVASGEWIDVIRGRDWLVEEIKTNVFVALINTDKVPYTDEGIAIIEKEIRRSLVLAQERGFVAPTEYDEDKNINLGFEIRVPLAANVSTNNKANRLLEDVYFTARLAGAIHNAKIKGNLTYNNMIVERVNA